MCYLWKKFILKLTPNLPDQLILKMFNVNLESVAFMKVKIILYQGKSYIVAKRNV